MRRHSKNRAKRQESPAFAAKPAPKEQVVCSAAPAGRPNACSSQNWPSRQETLSSPACPAFCPWNTHAAHRVINIALSQPCSMAPQAGNHRRHPSCSVIQSRRSHIIFTIPFSSLPWSPQHESLSPQLQSSPWPHWPRFASPTLCRRPPLQAQTGTTTHRSITCPRPCLIPPPSIPRPILAPTSTSLPAAILRPTTPSPPTNPASMSSISSTTSTPSA